MDIRNKVGMMARKEKRSTLKAKMGRRGREKLVESLRKERKEIEER